MQTVHTAHAEKVFNEYCKSVAMANGRQDTEKEFTVTPDVHAKIESTVVDQSEYLKKIQSPIPVTEMAGKNLMVGISNHITKRTVVTDVELRKAVEVESEVENYWSLTENEMDARIPWETIEQWTRFPNFQSLYRINLALQMATDRLQIAFNATSRATTTTSDPNLLDVDRGWPQQVEDLIPGNVYTEGNTGGSNQIRIGEAAGHDYKNLDEAIYDYYTTTIPNHKRSNDYISHFGADILARVESKYLADHASTPTEKLRINAATETYGGLRAIQPPMFPDGTILITPLKNLTHLIKKGSYRRRIVIDDERKAVIDWNHVWITPYVIDPEKVVIIKNVVFTW